MGAHMGFKKLEKKIEKSGKSAKSAAAITASIGMKKYGKEKMMDAAHKGKPLKQSQAKKK
jgi:hypothetical protein